MQQARDDHISQTYIEPVYCHHIGSPKHIGNRLDTGILEYGLGYSYHTEMLRLFNLMKGSNKPVSSVVT